MQEANFYCWCNFDKCLGVYVIELVLESFLEMLDLLVLFRKRMTAFVTVLLYSQSGTDLLLKTLPITRERWRRKYKIWCINTDMHNNNNAIQLCLAFDGDSACTESIPNLLMFNSISFNSHQEKKWNLPRLFVTENLEKSPRFRGEIIDGGNFVYMKKAETVFPERTSTA